MGPMAQGGTCDQREEGKEAEGSLTTQIQEVIIGAQHSSP